MEASVSPAYPDETEKDLPIHPRAGCVQGKEEGESTGEAYAEGRELTFLGRTRVTLLDPCSVSLLQRRKLRLREGKEHFHDHTATEEWRSDENLALLWPIFLTGESR